jgi:hypothetical protein
LPPLCPGSITTTFPARSPLVLLELPLGAIEPEPGVPAGVVVGLD